MELKQLSVFVENKSGAVSSVLDTLSEHHVDLYALSIADTADFGILRLIVRDPETTAALLRELGFVSKINSVLAIAVDDRPGGLAKPLSLLSEKGISVEDLYAFMAKSDAGALVILRTDNRPEAEATLTAAGVHILTADEVYSQKALYPFYNSFCFFNFWNNNP